MEVVNMPKVIHKGQVTIPLEIGKKLRIEAGDEIFFKEDAGKVVLIKISQGEPWPVNRTLRRFQQ